MSGAEGQNRTAGTMIFQSDAAGGPQRNHLENSGHCTYTSGTGRTQMDWLGFLPVILRSSTSHPTLNPQPASGRMGVYMDIAVI